MSTRTRIIYMDNRRQIFTGSVAIAVMIKQVNNSSSRIKELLSEKYHGLSKREKLTKLADSLPRGCHMVLFQEPRRTRRKYSLYWKSFPS